MTKTNVQSIPSNSQHHDTPNNKTHVIKFRVTENEKLELECTAKLLNLSLSTFIRHALHNAKIERTVVVAGGGEETLTAVSTLLAQCSRVGGNLNQLARHFNSGGADTEQIRAKILDELADLTAFRLSAEKKVFSGEVKFTNDEMIKLVQSSPDKRQDVFAEIMHPEITKAMEAADAEPNADTPVPMPTADPEQFKTYQVPDEFMRVYKTLSTATEMMKNTWKRVLKNNQSYLSDPEKQKVLRFAMQRPALYLNELEACMEQILAETLEKADKTA